MSSRDRRPPVLRDLGLLPVIAVKAVERHDEGDKEGDEDEAQEADAPLRPLLALAKDGGEGADVLEQSWVSGNINNHYG